MFSRIIGAFQRADSFLSQILIKKNSDIEKRVIFYCRFVPSLESGRERYEIDMSLVVLIHHQLKNKRERDMMNDVGDPDKLIYVNNIKLC